jgi:hypothetical protein
MRKKAHPGSLIEIDLRDGIFAYGQMVGKAQYAFFDYFGPSLQSEVLGSLGACKVVFVLAVMDSAVKSGRWKIVGFSELRPELKMPRSYFMQDAITKKFSIYDADTGNISSANFSEISGLECAAVWESEHVEDRLRDYQVGRPNPIVQRLSPKLPNPSE